MDAKVVNVDCSKTALERLEADVGFSEKQSYVLWDAAQDSLHDDFDLVLDKGTLDALQFAGSDDLISFFQALRRQQRALYLHWSDDAPEMKMDLLNAAFPSDDGYRCTFTEEEEDPDQSSSSLFQWTYYRYSVRRTLPSTTT